MKNYLILLTLFLIFSVCNAQWEQVVQEIYGEFEGDGFGLSVAISVDGNIIA